VPAAHPSTVPQCVLLITGLVDARSPRDLWRPTDSDYGVANVNIATSGAVFGGPSSDERHGGGFGASVLDRKHPVGCCHCAHSIKLVNPLLNGHSRLMTYLAAPESLSTEKSPSNNRANCSRAASAVLRQHRQRLRAHPTQIRNQPVQFTSRGPPRPRGSPNQIRRANSPVPVPVSSDRATRRPHAASNSDTAGPSTATPSPTVKPASSPMTLRPASRLLARPIGRRPGMRLQHRNRMRGFTGEPCKIRYHIAPHGFTVWSMTTGKAVDRHRHRDLDPHGHPSRRKTGCLM
jgi:hypothetical protein